MFKHLTLILAILLLSIAVVEVINANSIEIGGINATFFLTRNTSCMGSLRPSSEPRPLEFCYWQNAKSCCTPANDAAAKASFQDFTDLGPGCAPTDHKIRAAYREVRQFACLPCDPLEPKYRVDLTIGDKHLPGGQIDADSSAHPGAFAWRVCLSFIYGKDKKSGLWGNNGSKFDACGIRPADGSSDFTIPSVAFSGSNKSELAQGFVDMLPSFLPNFKAIVVNDSAPGFNRTATPCFASVGNWFGLGSCVIVCLVLIVLMMF